MAQTRRIAMADARASLKDLAEDVRDRRAPVKLTRYNRTLVGLVSAADLRLLEECRAELEACQEKKQLAAKETATATAAGRPRKRARR